MLLRVDSQSDDDESVDVPDSSDSDTEDKATDAFTNKIATRNLPNKGMVTMAAHTRVPALSNINNQRKN